MFVLPYWRNKDSDLLLVKQTCHSAVELTVKPDNKITLAGGMYITFLESINQSNYFIVFQLSLPHSGITKTEK